MRLRRLLLALLLGYQAFFLNVVLPGHTRGAVTLDGRHTGASCCCDDAAAKPKSGAPSGPSERDRNACAVCSFAARLTPPPVVDLVPPSLRFLTRLPLTPPVVVTGVERRLTYFGRGPPVGPV